MLKSDISSLDCWWIRAEAGSFSMINYLIGATRQGKDRRHQ